jgi:hypothetical protein
MSDLTPPDGPEDTAILTTPEPLQPPAAPKGRRTAIIAAVSVGVAAVLGGGALVAYKFIASGPQPSEALPASVLGVLSIDLDPGAKQKIEAIKTLHKFPGLKKSLNLGSTDDLRRYVFKEATKDGTCKNLTYDADILPWIGNRAAVAAAELGDHKVAPVFALEVSDVGKAETGVKKIIKCGGDGDIGYAFNDKYLIISDSTAHAKEIVADAKKAPLSDDAKYQKWSDAAGDAGIVNFYVSSKAATYVANEVGDLAGSLSGLNRLETGSSDSGGLPSGFPTDFPENNLPTPSDNAAAFHSGGGASAPRAADPTDPSGAIKDALKNFQGLAGSIRFAGGGMELEIVSGGIQNVAGSGKVTDEVESLPADTALALGVAYPGDVAKRIIDSVRSQFGAAADDQIAQAESMFGIKLPDDLQTLLGKAITLSLGGDAPASLDDVKGPADLPAGIKITGDADKIKAIITRLEDHSGLSLDDIGVVVESSGDKVALVLQSAYAKRLLADGKLGDTASFKKVVENADKASAVLYLNFDSDWTRTIAQAAGDAADTFGIDGPGSVDSVEANLKPLQALGFTTWSEGSESHVLLKVTTD